MRLYLADIKDVAPGHFEQISPERQEKTRRYRMEDDKKRCILGGLMLKRFLGDTKIYLNPGGKPLAENGVCFNLSHSGDYVLLAVDSFEVGCDIEKLRPVEHGKMGRIVFCENELQKIKSSPDKTGEFFRLWTKKEALLKCMGEGFHRAAKSVDVSSDVFEESGKEFRMKTYTFADYMISVCTTVDSFAGDIEFVKF